MSHTIVDLIRHGEPLGGSLYRGHTVDDPLSEKGWQQMWQAVGDYNQWQQIISSPMLRCSEFSQQLAKRNNIPIQAEDNLKEVGFGTWEGLTREQVKQQDLMAYTNFYADPVNNRPEGSENLQLFIQRVITCYEKIINKFENKHVLIVAHAGVIRAILAHIVHAPAEEIYNFKIDNAAISRIDVDSNNILFMNQTLI